MARKRTHKTDEDLRGTIRELTAENKALRRKLRQLEKSKHLWNLYSLEAEDKEETIEIKEIVCPECKAGVLVYVDLGIKELMSCSNCKYRTKAKNK